MQGLQEHVSISTEIVRPQTSDLLLLITDIFGEDGEIKKIKKISILLLCLGLKPSQSVWKIKTRVSCQFFSKFSTIMIGPDNFL